MSLKDIMSHADLSLYPEVALLIFLTVFLAMAWKVSRRDVSEDDYAAALPLGGEPGPEESEA